GGAALQPAVAAGEALVEDPGQVLPADAHAVVGDDQILPPGVHRHAAAGGVLHRVGQDLLHHQLKPLLVGEDGEVRLPQVQGHPAADEETGVPPGRLAQNLHQGAGADNVVRGVTAQAEVAE